MEHFSESGYNAMISALFKRFPSFQKAGAGAYKPGIANMEFMSQLLGHPHRKYRIIHVAGTNGKGSVSNMLTSVLASCGFRVGLYTSPHILDFRERMRILDGRTGEMKLVGKDFVWDFIGRWNETFDHLDLSFFEITTSMAFEWFASENVDMVVLETGLGGRLDSTNIVNPVLSVITNIGLDHCDMLGGTLPEIAYEKAGIIKPSVPVVVGESGEEIDEVFRRKVLYSNLSEPAFMGDREKIMKILTFADKVEPSLWGRAGEMLEKMDLRGDYQAKNLRTVLAALDVLLAEKIVQDIDSQDIITAIENTSARTGFRGRWERLSSDPVVICDIGHNGHGLKYNFAQLERMVGDGEATDVIMVYGSVADKDLDAVLDLMPETFHYIFTQADSRRALPAERIRERFLELYPEPSGGCPAVYERVSDAVKAALDMAAKIKGADGRPVIYIGGSTYVAAEAVSCF